jgi:hypothetical protein
MFNFKHNSTANRWRSRRDKRRLLMMVFSLGLAVMLMAEAGKPKNWQWLWGGKPPASASQPTKSTDHLIPPTPQPEYDPDVLTYPVAEKEPSDAKQPPSEPSRYFPGVRPEYLLSIRDHTTSHKSGAEKKAWNNFLEVLIATDPKRLRKASRGQVTVAQLKSQADTYRGELVTLDGHVVRCEPLRSSAKQFGVETYYRLMVAVNGKAAVVYCLNLPEDFPKGDGLREKIKVTGFFYKVWSYLIEGEDTVFASAPMVLAKDITWHPPALPVRSEPVTMQYVVICAVVAAVIGIVFAYWVYRRSEASGAEEMVRPEPTSFDHLIDQGVLGIGETIQKTLDEHDGLKRDPKTPRTATD